MGNNASQRSLKKSTIFFDYNFLFWQVLYRVFINYKNQYRYIPKTTVGCLFNSILLSTKYLDIV